MEKNKDDFKPNKGKNLKIATDYGIYFRLPVKTHLLTEKDNIFELINEKVAPFLKENDIIFVSEKALAITQGQIIPIKDIKPSKFAKFLSRRVRNYYGTKKFRGFGHGTPMAMQLFIQEAGTLRVFLAACVSALTRPLGIPGAFYFLSGKKAKSVDCPMSFTMYPYTHYAKLPPKDPVEVAKRIKEKFNSEAVIVDANYRGVCSLGKSSGQISEKFIYQVFKDNPLGQSDEMTPLCIVRKETEI